MKYVESEVLESFMFKVRKREQEKDVLDLEDPGKSQPLRTAVNSMVVLVVVARDWNHQQQ